MAANKNRSWPEWYRVIQGRDLLHPEFEYKFKVIPEGLFKNLQKRAAEMLKERPSAATHEKEHWQSLVDGKVPFGLMVEKKTKRGQNEKHSS